MRRITGYLTALVAVVLLAAGCQTVTGRTMGTWVGDKALTAKVKTKLAATEAKSITRVNVDTFDRTVYLTGAVPDEQTRNELINVARNTSGVRRVVSNLEVTGNTVAASPRSEAPIIDPHPSPSAR